MSFREWCNEWYDKWFRYEPTPITPLTPPKWGHGEKTQPREVILFRRSGKVSIVEAFPSDSGWIANWTANRDKDEWSILLPNGEVEGTEFVTGWKPHKGWTEDAVI